jgi:signal transduction histidine kinase
MVSSTSGNNAALSGSGQSSNSASWPGLTRRPNTAVTGSVLATRWPARFSAAGSSGCSIAATPGSVPPASGAGNADRDPAGPATRRCVGPPAGLRPGTDAAGAATLYGASMQLRRVIDPVLSRRWVADGLLALAVGTVNLLAAGVSNTAGVGRTPWRPLDALGYLLLVAGPLALVFRRRWPLGVLVAVQAASIAYSARTYPEGGTGLTGYVALYTLAVWEQRRWLVAAATAASVATAFTLEVVFYGTTMIDGEPFYVAGVVLSATFLGEAVRNRRAYVTELRNRAELAERTKEEEARRRVDEERLRIARELHDVVSHSIGVISVQAGVASHLLERRPDKAAKALVTIREASDEALGELHAMLGVLRQPDGQGAPLTPAPGLAQLGALVAQAEAAGLQVAVAVDDGAQRLPPALDLACYRIVQESLTNVVRHAHARHATVTVTAAGDALVVTVDDDGTGAAAPGSGTGNGAGQGIVGMRERARALGGTLEAGPRREGGFRVRASLPVGVSPTGVPG